MTCTQITQWGIRLINGKTIQYIPQASKNEAISAKNAWDEAQPSSQPQLVHRIITKDDWEL